MKANAPSRGISDELGIKPVRCPTSLKTAARALNAENRNVGSHEKNALRHAVTCGALLHWAKSQVKHGDWQSWVKKNFEGSETLARDYMKLARAVAKQQNSAVLSSAESVNAALQLARSMPVPNDLPAALPGLMDPLKLRVVKNDDPEPESSAEPDGDSAIPLKDELDEKLRKGHEAAEQRERERQERKAAAQEASPSEPAIQPLYPTTLAALDMVARALGAFRADGRFSDLTEVVKNIHLELRGVVLDLHARGEADV